MVRVDYILKVKQFFWMCCSICNNERAYVFAYNYVTKYMMKYRMCFCIRLLVHFFMVMLQKHTKLEITRSHLKIHFSGKKENFTRIQFCTVVSPNTLDIIDLVKLPLCFDKIFQLKSHHNQLSILAQLRTLPTT